MDHGLAILSTIITPILFQASRVDSANSAVGFIIWTSLMETREAAGGLPARSCLMPTYNLVLASFTSAAGRGC